MKLIQVILLLSFFLINETLGSFVQHQHQHQNQHQQHHKASLTDKQKIGNCLPNNPNHQRCSSHLAMDFGSGFGKFFNLNNNNGSNNNNGGSGKDDMDNDHEPDDDDDEDEYEYVGCTNIFRISAKSYKLGACRLYLSLFFMGESNIPERGSWKMNQNGDGGIDLYYKDTTGALIVVFEEDAILVNRLGSSPSMDYLLQESSMLNGMLDQLDEIARDSSINESNRLLCIEDNAINAVRESLSFT